MLKKLDVFTGGSVKLAIPAVYNGNIQVAPRKEGLAKREVVDVE